MKKTIFNIAILLLIIAIIATPIYLLCFNDHTCIGKITDKERISTPDDSYYLVFIKDIDGEVRVVKNTDEIFRLKFDSSDMYGALEVGKTYEFVLVGYRIQFLSMYENIVSYTIMK